MATIEVTETSQYSFSVTIKGTHTTIHQVSVQPEYAQQLTAGCINPKQLVMASIQYLLDRESNTSILRSFDLRVIERYFPDYTQQLKHYI